VHTDGYHLHKLVKYNVHHIDTYIRVCNFVLLDAYEVVLAEFRYLIITSIVNSNIFTLRLKVSAGIY